MTDALLWTALAAIALLLALSALLAAAETAYTLASRPGLRHRADRGEAGAARALRLVQDAERLSGATLGGKALSRILAVAVATAAFGGRHGLAGVALAALGMTLLILTLAELLPKLWAFSDPDGAAIRLSAPVAALVAVFAPPVAALRRLAGGALRLLGIRIQPGDRVLSAREDILDALALGLQDSTVGKEDRDRLRGALDLGDRTVEEVMRHRSAIEVLDAALPAPEILERCLASPHTRLPLYRGEPENIVGVLHSKDLMRAVYARQKETPADPFAGFDILEVAQKPYFVPETTPLDDQMREFLARRRQFALVVDEYGALEGLITLEDILEEIVGEITDEYDVETSSLLRRDAEGAVTIDGTMTIRDFNRATDSALPDEEANTMAGLVIHEAQTIPNAGQVFVFHGHRFEVLQRKANRIARLKVIRLDGGAVG